MIAEKTPERGWIPLYVLSKLGRIPTAVKFQKLTFLIEIEGRVDGYSFFKKHYGPYSEELAVDIRSFSESQGLMQTQIIEGTRYPYYVYTSTEKGNAFVKDVIEKKIPIDIRERVDEIIDCYKDKNYRELQEYVYEKYVIKPETFEEVYPNLSDNLISLENLWEKWYSDNCPAAFLTLAVIEYSTKVLSKLKTITDDQVLRGVCISSISELTNRLVELSSVCNTSDKCPLSLNPLFSEISDQIDFIEHYCCKNDILGNMMDIDFSDFINEEELGRLERELATTQPSELMY